METDSPGAAEWAALRRLLDDPSPAVRRALLVRFAAIGPAAAGFLHGIAGESDPNLARHARLFLGELDLSDPVGEFRTFIRSRQDDLETGSLLLARTVSPQLDFATCRDRLDALAARCRELIAAPASAREQCRLINRVLFHEWGFHGNVEHYTDPRNSLLDQVLARRTGLPISLSIVYLLVAGRLGLDLSPVGLPGHFLVGCFHDERPFFVDPFDRGVFRDAAELFELLRARQVAPKLSDLAPTPAREVLCRCCRNLVHHYAAAADPGRTRLFARFVADFEATPARAGRS